MSYRLLLLSLLLFTSSIQAETVFTLSSGLDASSGNYGTSSTTSILYVPVTLKAQFDYSYLKLTLPFVSISSAGGVIPGNGPLKKNAVTKVSTNAGMGDAVLTGGYTLYESSGFALDGVAVIKFGTADAAQNLGTGENDYSAQMDAFYTIDKLTWFGTAGYKIVGVPPGIYMHNIFYGLAGASKKTSDTTTAGVMLYAAQSSSDATAGPLEVTFFMSRKLSPTKKIQAGLLKGLSDGSPDIGLNIMMTVTL